MSYDSDLHPAYYRSTFDPADIPASLDDLEGTAGAYGAIVRRRAEIAAAIIWAATGPRPCPYRGALSAFLSDLFRHVEEASVSAGFIPAGARLVRDGREQARQRKADRLLASWRRAGSPSLPEGINVAFADLAHRVQVMGALHGLLSGVRRDAAQARGERVNG